MGAVNHGIKGVIKTDRFQDRPGVLAGGTDRDFYAAVTKPVEEMQYAR